MKPFIPCLFLLFGLLLAGCGGDDATSDPTSNSNGDSDRSTSETEWDSGFNPPGDTDTDEFSEYLPGDEDDLDGPEDETETTEDDRDADDVFERETIPENERETTPEIEREEADDPGDFACDRLDFCPSNQVCNLALGRCEKRSTFVDYNQQFFSFHPRVGRSGDLLVIDGQAFYTSLAGNFSVKVWIGATQLQFLQFIAWDENRLLVRIPSGASGLIGVQCETGYFLQSSEEFGVAPEGTIACDGSTPAARNETASTPTQIGPYAAGYLDYTNEGVRVFYPASCGSLRRPGVPGTYPLVAILHGNGAGHVNYEYLGQLLASRGFVVVNPPSTHTNSYDEEVIRTLKNSIEPFHDTDLGGLHPALSGLSTTGELGFICHSRGCGRQMELMGDYPSLARDTEASVFLGPVGSNEVVPGHFMSIGATNDGQSFASYYTGDYNRHSAPKWLVEIQGGNHSLFADAKTYFSMDGVPAPSRQRQLSIVASFVVPLMERAFGKAEPHSEWLDDPPESTDYTVESDL